MNSLVFFTIFTIVIFVLFFIALIIFKKDALFTVGIGSIIGANIYNIGSYPIFLGSLVFGLDSIIYTIFVFCVLLMYIQYGKSAMKSVLYTSVASIFFTALLGFAGSYSQNGVSSGLIWSSLSYLNSIIATLIAIYAMIFVFDWLRKKHFNSYFNIIIVLIIALVLNTIIYFGLTFIFSGSLGSDFLNSLAGSSIGKVIATLLCVLIFHLQENKTHKNQTKI